MDKDILQIKIFQNFSVQLYIFKNKFLVIIKWVYVLSTNAFKEF